MQEFKFQMLEKDKIYIDRIFKLPHMDEEQSKKAEYTRAFTRALVSYIFEACPDNRQRMRALSRIEEAIMWVDASLTQPR